MEIKRTVSDLRNRFDEVAELCGKSPDAVIITRNGSDELAVMSAASYRNLKSSLDTLNEQLDGLYEQVKKFERTFNTLSIMADGNADLKSRAYGIDEEFDRIMEKFSRKGRSDK